MSMYLKLPRHFLWTTKIEEKKKNGLKDEGIDGGNDERVHR